MVESPTHYRVRACNDSVYDTETSQSLAVPLRPEALTVPIVAKRPAAYGAKLA